MSEDSSCGETGRDLSFAPGSSSGGRRNEDKNNEGGGLSPVESYLEKLEDIEHLSPLNVSHLHTVLPEKGSLSGPPSSPPSTSEPVHPVHVDEHHDHFFSSMMLM